MEYNVTVKRLERELEEAERDVGRLEKKIEDINRKKNEAIGALFNSKGRLMKRYENYSPIFS